MLDLSYFDPVFDRTTSSSIKYRRIPTHNHSPIIPMWIADMDFRSPPAVIQALIEAAQHGIYGYAGTDDEYDDLVTGWYAHRMGWQFSAEQLIKVPGVIFGAVAALRALTLPGDPVLICQPVYYPFANMILNDQRKLVVSQLVLQDGRYQIDFDDFERKIRQNQVKVFLFCSPHNPVGRVWLKEELSQIAQICLRNNVFIISDEIHSDFVFQGHRHIPMAALSPAVAERTITCLSPTKTFNLAGLQAANLVVFDRQLRKKIHVQCLSTGYSNLNLMAIAATKAAYRDGAEWLDTLLRYLQQSIALLRDAFPQNYPVSFMNLEGTYLAWLDCRKLNLPPSELDHLFLHKAGILLHHGTTFGAGGSGFMRMNIACPHAVLKQAITQIHSAVDGLKGAK